MNVMSKEQVAKITDLESFKTVTGKRFRRTKDETDRKLTAEEALQERLAEGGMSQTEGYIKEIKRQHKVARKANKAAHAGEIIVRLTPDKSVKDTELLNLIGGPIEIKLDEKYYAWLYEKLDHPYKGDITKFFNDIFELGLGEVITNVSS